MSGIFRRLKRNEIQNNASHKEGKTTDLTRLRLERRLKRPMTDNQLQAEDAKKRRLIGEDGRPRKKEVQLARRYGQDNPGLAAGGWGETKEDIVRMLQEPQSAMDVTRKKAKYQAAISNTYATEKIKEEYRKRVKMIEEAEEEVKASEEAELAEKQNKQSE